MIKLIGDDLWQWDTGRSVEITARAGCTVDKVHYFNGTTSNAVPGAMKKTDSGATSKIPNDLLQSENNLVVYSVMVDGYGAKTTESVIFGVNRREKPVDYNPNQELEDLKEKVENIDERVIEAVNKYLEENPPDNVETANDEYPIKRIESLDEENLVNLRDIESGIYILYGYFKPFPGSDSTLIIDNGYYMIARVDEGSHLLSISPLNFRMTCHEILVDDTNEKGFTYTNNRINLLDVYNTVSANGVKLADRTTGQNYKVYVDNGKLTMEGV